MGKAEHSILHGEKRASFQNFGNFGGEEPGKNWKCTKVHESWCLRVPFSAQFKIDHRLAKKINFHGVLAH